MLRYAGQTGQTVRAVELLVPDAMPFVGVLLALVVTVISTMPSISSAKLDLPPAVICSCIAEPEPPRIRVLETSITVNDRPSSMNSLLSDVQTVQGQDERQGQRNSVILSATAETPYGKVAETVDRLSGAGFRVSLTNEDVT